MAWEDEGGDFLRIKEGDTVEFKVKKIEEKEPYGKIQPLSGRNYFYEFQTNKGNLIINNTGLLFALTNAKVREGDTIKVKYVKKGSPGIASTFEVEILEKGDTVEEVPF